MAQLVLSNVGSAIGSRLLPNGVAAFGAQVSGAAIGRALAEQGAEVVFVTGPATVPPPAGVTVVRV